MNSSSPTILDSRSRDRLVRVLGMLGSAYDGERAVAAATANRIVHEMNLRWDDVIAPARLPAPKARRPEPKARRPEPPTRSMIAEGLLELAHLFTPWETDFLKTVLRWRGPLTRKQEEVFARLIFKAEKAA